MLDRLNYWFLFIFYYCLYRWKRYFKKQPILDLIELAADPTEDEISRELLNKEEETLLFQGVDDDNAVFIEIHLTKEWITANLLFVINGKKYTLPYGPLQKARFASTTHLLDIGWLRVELREPLRRWRIAFRGDLRDQDGNVQFVHWNSWWASLSDPYMFFQDVPINLIATCAAETQCSSFYDSLESREDFLQWGMFRSRLIIEDSDQLELDLRGFRIKKFTNGICVDRLTTAFMTNGDRTARFELTIPNCLNPLEFGRHFGGDRFNEPLNCLFDEEVEHIALHCLNLNSTTTSTNVEISRLTKNRGNGFVWFLENNKIKVEERTVPINHQYKANEIDKKFNILPFTHRACMDSELTGGKGSNLSRLTGLQHNFIVPKGLLVTVEAFHKHLRSNVELLTFVKSLERETTHDFEATEERAHTLFMGTKLNENLLKSIHTQLQQIFDDRLHNIKFAVRSSAVGEDGANLSSAGQLESYLYVDLDSIASKVLQCWASNFRREILSYRFENGQPLNTPMAVVVQEMIGSGIAGVMFTNDPVKGDPSKVILNIVNGDGEQLVSGRANPTQLIISKRNMQIVEKKGEELLLDNACLELVKVALYLEHSFDYAQDIEFVYKADRIYVVQSRNITNLDAESDWELQHEFDSALLTNELLLTTANVGEVMSIPLQALDCFTTANAYDRTIQSTLRYTEYQKPIIDKHHSAIFMLNRQRIFLEMVESLLRNWQTLEKNRIPEYNIAGTTLFTDETFQFGRNRFTAKHPISTLYDLYKVAKMIFRDSWIEIKKAKEILEEMKLCVCPSNDLNSILNAIRAQRHKFIQILNSHTMESAFSSITYTFVAMLLRGTPEGDVSPQLFAGIATIYSNNTQDIISADVPILLKKIAIAIKSNEEIRNKFSKSSAREAISCLKNDDSECGTLFRNFLKKHGHRGNHELLLSGIPWSLDFEHLASTLRMIIEDSTIENTAQKAVISDLNTLLDSLSRDLSANQRRGLRFFIPHAHRAVAFRETAKNYLVFATFLLRNSYWQLAKEMNKQKLITRPDLLFHMTFTEIEQLVKNGQNFHLLMRARRRQKIYESQFELNYPLISIGRPISLSNQSNTNYTSDLKLYGTTVCEGRVIGRARVVKSLLETRDTKNGEILITICTDIAWSPLFPILKGLVTEIGGLLSHGAVVAREYSLPCVIAVENATNCFKTGDKVLLDATKGIIERLSED